MQLDESDSVTLEGGGPAEALAGLPLALVVSSLGDQLERFASGYTPTDYLTPVLAARALLMDRHGGDPEAAEAVSGAFGRILGSVARAVQLDWGADLGQLGLDPCSASYPGDLQELYGFFVCGRLAHARDLLYRVVRDDRRRLADRHRRAVEKRNQTTAEARKVLASFDDVVVWTSMPQILREMAASGDWSFPLGEALERLEGPDPSQGDPEFLAGAARALGDPGFAARYAAPALGGRGALAETALVLRTRWFAEAPKKRQQP